MQNDRGHEGLPNHPDLQTYSEDITQSVPK
jgi:hypothetical protein